MKTCPTIVCAMAATAALVLAAGEATAGQRRQSSASFETSVVVKVSGNASTNITVNTKDGGVRVDVKASASGSASSSGHASGSASGSSSGSSSKNGGGGQQVQPGQGVILLPGDAGTRRGH